MASVDDIARKCAIVSGIEDDGDVPDIINTIAAEAGVKPALNVRRIGDGDDGQPQYLVTLQKGMDARKFIMCKQYCYRGQTHTITSRECTDEDLTEVVGSEQIQGKPNESPLPPEKTATLQQENISSGWAREQNNEQNCQNQQTGNQSEQPPVPHLVNPTMQMPHHQFGAGGQPQPGSGIQSQGHGGIQPQVRPGFQHQHGPGIHPQQGPGIQPQQSQVRPGMQHQYGIPPTNHGMQPRVGPAPHPRHGLNIQPQGDPRMQFQFRNQIQPGPRMPAAQQFHFQDQYGYQHQLPYPHPGQPPFYQEQPPFHPGQFQNAPQPNQFRGPPQGYEYQGHSGFSGVNPAFPPPQYGEHGPHRHQYTEPSQARTPEEKMHPTSAQANEGQEPEIRKSHMVEVQNLPEDTTEDAVHMYFENKRRSGGGDVRKVTLDRKRNSALVDFEKYDSAAQVLEREHAINKKQVRVSLYDEDDEDKDDGSESGDEEKPLCTIEVRGFKEGSSDETIEMYFESTKRSGGDTVATFERRDDVIFITFETQEVAERVVKKSHEIDKRQLTVKLHKPKPCYKNRFLVSNLNMTTTKESLLNFMEARSRCEVTSVQYGDTPGIALVSFDEGTILNLVALREECKKKKLESRHVELSAVPIADSIMVTGLDPKTTSDTIMYYFEGKRCGNEKGAEVTVTRDEEDEHCIVQFDDHKVIDMVLSKKRHEIEKRVLTLSLYIEGLGIGQSTGEDSWYKQPESFTVNAFNKYKGMFLQKTKDQTLQMQLEKLFAELTWINDDSASFKCTLTKDTVDAVKKSRTWRKDVEKCFNEHLEKLEVGDVTTLTEIWEDVRKGLDSIAATDGSEMFVSETKPKVVVVGSPSTVTQVLNEVKIVVSSIEEEVNRKKQEVTDVITNIKPLKLRLLLAIGFHEEVKKKLNEVSVIIKLKSNEIIFKGQIIDVNSCKVEMYEKLNTFCGRDVPEMSKAKLSFLSQREVRDFIISKMKTKNLYGVWESEVDRLVVLATCEEGAFSVVDLLNEQVLEHVESLSSESFFLLKSEKWTQLCETLTSQHDNLAAISSDSNRNIIIIATAPIIDGIKVKIQKFISENSVYNRIITFPKPVYRFMNLHVDREIQQISHQISNHKGKIEMKKDSPVIIVYGCKEGLDEAVQELKRLGERITTEKHTLQKDGIGKYIHSDRIRNIISETEKSGRCVIEFMYDKSETIKIEGGQPEQSQIHTQGAVQYAVCEIGSGRRIEVLKTDMTTMQVDAIVNAANNRLDHVGGLARAIAKKGGPSIQRESDEYTRKHKSLRAGEVVVTGAGHLPCKRVMHAVGPVWSGGKQKEERDLKRAITASLESADDERFTSIVFPALSAGIFGYPVDLSTTHIVEAISKYFRDMKGSTLRVVYLVDVGETTVKHFVTAVKDVFYDKTVSTSRTPASSSLSTAAQMSKGRANRKFTETRSDVALQGSIEIVLVQGEIAQQAADVIVNSASHNLDLTHGTVSKTILKAGGNSLQHELRKKYPNGIKAGDIAVTSHGNLNCQTVYHTCLSNWGDTQSEMLQQLVSRCLEMASDLGYSTIAFPALGSGVLGYPRDLVARTMYTVVEAFNRKNRSLTEVRFVVYAGDKATVKAFQQEDADMKSRRNGKTVSSRPIIAPKPARRSRLFQAAEEIGAAVPGQGTSLIQIEVKQGEINQERADVLVNSTSPSLDLSVGGVSKALLNTAGSGLQKELKTNYPKGIKPNDLAVTSGYNLHCEVVYHTCLSRWTGSESDLNFLVVKCLTEASNAGLKSISFPALGTGNLGYPTPVVAQTMLKAVEDFQHLNKSLQRVSVVIHPKDKEIYGAFEDARMHKPISNVFSSTPRRFIQEEEGFPVEESGAMCIGHIGVVVKSGNLVKEPADCIINSTNIELDLRKGGVSGAIAKEGGQSLTTKCLEKADEMRQKGVISTTAIGLQCKYVIHVAAEHFGNDWKFVIAACLNEARALGDINSIAFPILGTGTGHSTPQQMADMMATTISQFESQAGNVVEVRVVVFQDKMLAPFERQMRSSIATIGKSGLKTYRDTGLISQGSVDLFVFSDDNKHIEEGIRTLKKKCDKELNTKEIKDEMISKLTDKQIKQLKKDFAVDLVVDRKKCQMKITGFAEHSGDAMIEVMNYIRDIEKKEKDTERATLLSRSVQWRYIEKDANGQETQKNFDPMANSDIEKAYEGKKTDINVEIPRGELDIDLSTLQGFLRATSEKINILRRDLFKEAAASIFDPPKTWAPMPENDNFISCDASGSEFNEVSQLFLATVGNFKNAKVLHVKRIQNRALYQQYTAKKKQLEKQNPAGTQNERRLWHGTSTDTIESINLHGYNRSYCGKNATYYGLGVYFAVNSNYSAHDKYSRPDAQKHKYMYLARVLTGVYTKGDGSMRTPPPKDKAKPTDLCDSVTNDVSNPAMFVVFNDTMAYPEYLVTFTI